MRVLTCVASLAALGAATAALAQAAADEDRTENTIVVTGRTELPPRREVFDQALELSRVTPGQMYEEALARFTAPLCPSVTGLREDLAAEMVERIRSNAAGLSVALGKPRCAPNLIVAFAADGQSLVRDLGRKYPHMFEQLDEAERDELLTETAPARVWNVVQTKRADGAPLPRWRGKIQMPSVRGRANQMFLPTRKDIEFTLIVFDREAALGLSVIQLADYATMRGLSHTRAGGGDEPMNTILALFEDGGDGVAELTPFDIGYLRSVYFWKPERSVPAAGRLLSVRRRAEAARHDAE